MKKLVGIILPIMVAFLAVMMPVMPATGNGAAPILFVGNFDTQWNTPIRGAQRIWVPPNPPEGGYYIDPSGLDYGGIWNVVPDDAAGDYLMSGRSSDANHRGTGIFSGDVSLSSYTLEARLRSDGPYPGLVFYADGLGQKCYDVYFAGYVEIWKNFDGIWGRNPLKLQVSGMDLTQWYKVKVTVANSEDGTEIKVWYTLDGEEYDEDPQVECIDGPANPWYDGTPPYTSGRIGFIYYDDYIVEGHKGFFDDVVVAAADGSILFSDSFDQYLAKWHKLGSTIPLKWQYTDCAGNVVDSANANPVIGWSFASATPASGTLIEEDAAGASGLRYNSSSMTWEFNWKTKGLREGVYNLIITSNQPASSGPIRLA